MPLGIGIGQVVGLLREVRASEDSVATIAVAGPGASDFAAELAAGGDARAVVVGGNALGATVAVRLLDGDPSPEEASVLRNLARAGVPVVVVRTGSGSNLPHTLADDVIEVDGGHFAPDVARAIARVAGSAAPPLAARLPTLRSAVSSRLVNVTAWTSAAVAASATSLPQLPVLAFAQSRMLVLLGLARGGTLPRDPQTLALAAGPSLAGAIAAGYVGRTIVRNSPVRGPIVRAVVAYASTRLLATARQRF